jgi:hypothetical protein
MKRVYFEAQFVFSSLYQFRKVVGWHLKAAPTLGADQVWVCPTGQLIGRRTMANMAMDDNPHSLKLFEASIDRREMDFWGASVNKFCESLCAVVSIGCKEHLEENSTRIGGTPAASTYLL